jgi:hypothetical protein
LYFILGLLIAFIVVPMLAGCEQGKTTAGVAVIEDVDIVFIDRPPCIGWGCERPTDPPGCWYPGNTQYCDEPIMCCMALMPTCMACQDGCTVDAWLEKTCGSNATDAEYAGWDEIQNEPVWLCKAEIIN